MTFVFIPYKPMENKFHMIIIAKLWPMKYVMIILTVEIEKKRNKIYELNKHVQNTLEVKFP
jgi:hypothetical protein